MTDARTLAIEAVHEAAPGEHCRRLFRERWPAYRKWMARAEDVPVKDCMRALEMHMPELMPVFDRLHVLFGSDEEVARFLSLYRPPRLVRACAQVVLDTPDGPTLLRTYDFAPHLFDGIVLFSQWSEYETIAVTDCIWGALDGINSAGLSVALAFGGRNANGPGFAAVILVRYILDTCASVTEAREVLRRVPVFMPYTFVLVDADGDFVTAFVAPDRPAEFHRARASTNHQNDSAWHAYQRFSASGERLDCLNDLLDQTSTFEEFREAFLQPPIWRTRYALGSGTLYVAEYRPATRSLDLHWPGRSEHFSPAEFKDRALTVSLPQFNRPRVT